MTLQTCRSSAITRARARRAPGIVALAFMLGILAGRAGATTVTVGPNDLLPSPAAGGWWFVEDPPSSGNATGSLVQGPGAPPLGVGSARMVLDGSANGRELLGTVDYTGTRLDTLTTLTYSSYRASADAGNLLSISLQFDLDCDLTDADTAFQGRLVFEPYFTAGSGTILQNTWYAWNPLDPNAKWYMTGTPRKANAPFTNPCPQSGPCTLSSILSTHCPNGGIRTVGPGTGGLYFKAGAPWPNFDGNVDAFTIGVSGSNTIFDFEPCAARHVATSGSDASNDCHAAGAPCQTIQHAIDVACAGDTVNIASGTYAENVTVTKRVTVIGAGQGSTIVEPALSSPNPCGGSLCGGTESNVFLVRASNVTIQDLTCEGDNPGLTSGVVAGGADVDARNGIITDHLSGVYNDLVVHHVTVKDIYLRGIYASTGGTFDFHDDTVDNVQANFASIAMFNFGGSGTMQNNTVTRANDAISANHSRGTQFLDNTIMQSASGVHTDNAGDGGGTADLIQNNHVSACTTDGYGIWVFVPYIAPTFSGNTVTGCAVGMAAFGGGAPVTTIFTGNQVDGTGAPVSSPPTVGALATTDQLGFGTGDSSTQFTYNTIQHFGDGFYLDQPGSALTLAASGNIITDNGDVGVEVAGGTGTFTCNLIASNDTGIRSATAATVAHMNSIVGNTTVGADGSAIPSGTMNAQNNWWGCAAGPGNAGCDTVTANVDASSPGSAPPPCVSCTADSDCDDGLACNGAEMCNTGLHVCQAGTPVSCSLGGADPQCNDGTCHEPSGSCTVDPRPNGTSCTSSYTCSAAATCQSGVCVADGGDPDSDGICSLDDNCPNDANLDQADLDGDGLGNVCDPQDATLTVNKLRLRRNTSTADNSYARTKGSFLLGTGDSFDASSGITVKIVDSLSTTATHTWTAGECVTTGTRIRCRGADRSSAQFKPLHPTPSVILFNVKMRQTALAGPFASPVTATVTHGTGVDRVGAISDCKTSNSGLSCRQF